jgi:hypothetical protein
MTVELCPHCGGSLTRSEAPTGLKSRDHRLIDTLDLAVPMWLELLAALDEAERDRHIWWWAKTAIQPVCERGDVLMYGGGKKGQAAEVFNYLASGLAALAYCPGGVNFAGSHYCPVEAAA